MSESYFKDRLTKLGVRPVMLTTQLMYPGAFILRDAYTTTAPMTGPSRFMRFEATRLLPHNPPLPRVGRFPSCSRQIRQPS